MTSPGTYLKKLRESKNITRYEVAKNFKVNYQSVYAWESGYFNFSPKIYQKASKAYKLSKKEATTLRNLLIKYHVNKIKSQLNGTRSRK